MFYFYRYLNYIPTLYNTYREILINEKLIFNGKTPYTILVFLEGNIFSQKSTDLNMLELYSNSITNFNDIYKKQWEASLCETRTNDFFSSDEECLRYMNGIMNYDFNMVTNSFIEEIILQAQYIMYYLSTNEVINISSDVFNNLGQLKGKNFRYILFEDENISLHHKLNVIFSNLYIPTINYYLDITANTIIGSFNNISSSITAVFIFYFCFIFVVNFIIIFPMILGMNTILFKSKKILNIIPIHILLNLQGINKLLNLSQFNNIYNK